MRDPAGMRWSRLAGKTRDRQIKAAPEEMYRAAFAAKTRAELLEYAIALNENPPEPVGIFGIVRVMLLVAIEGDWILNLVRQHVDLNRQFQIIQRLHDSLIELRD